VNDWHARPDPPDYLPPVTAWGCAAVALMLGSMLVVCIGLGLLLRALV